MNDEEEASRLVANGGSTGHRRGRPSEVKEDSSRRLALAVGVFLLVVFIGFAWSNQTTRRREETASSVEVIGDLIGGEEGELDFGLRSIPELENDNDDDDVSRTDEEVEDDDGEVEAKTEEGSQSTDRSEAVDDNEDIDNDPGQDDDDKSSKSEQEVKSGTEKDDSKQKKNKATLQKEDPQQSKIEGKAGDDDDDEEEDDADDDYTESDEVQAMRNTTESYDEEEEEEEKTRSIAPKTTTKPSRVERKPLIWDLNLKKISTGEEKIEPMTSPNLVFVKGVKVGGTSIAFALDHMAQAYSIRQAKVSFEKNQVFNYFPPSCKALRGTLYYRHGYRNPWQSICIRNVRHTTVLRDPISQILSYESYVLNSATLVSVFSLLSPL